MHNNRSVLPIAGITLFAIVTAIDVFVISLPVSVYVAVLLAGIVLVMSVFDYDAIIPQLHRRERRSHTYRITRADRQKMMNNPV